MYIEKQGKSFRNHKISLDKEFSSDIDYLEDYYKKFMKFPLFSQVLLETRTDCNRKCVFCPQFHFERPIKIMKWNVFKKVIDELEELNFGGRIALFMTNEPLLEERLLKMISYARNKSPRFFLDITTNGKLLTLEFLDKLLKSGVDNININDYRSDRINRPDGISKNLIEIFQIFKNNPKISFNKRYSKEVLSNYAGIIKEKNNQLINEFCNFPFRKLAISADGNIILCCNDYNYSTDFGNIIDKKIDNIWFSQDLNNFRINLLKGIRAGLCKNCNQIQNYNVFV